ncbi:MAG: RNA-binding S4 domain-containing protein [Anaerolineae bacterium]|nr:RNA-binding S4 domain-containing protein [Anaerolineae bacterium]
MTTLSEETIRLGQFLKLAGLVATGGEAKRLIQEGRVTVNGEVETRRKRQLHPGDEVAVGEEIYVVVVEDDPEPPTDGEGDR